MFEGFSRRRIATAGAEINLVIGGEGPPLLLLHGFPQTHACWHEVAPALARRFTVVASDLRGYGDSEKVASDPDHAAYSKRAMAADQVEAMRALGFEEFQVVSHDRGARVAHRMALDHPDSVRRLCVMDIVPTLTTYERADQRLARAYYHWFFLIQPAPMPEHMIGLDPEFFLRKKVGMWNAGTEQIASEAFAEYLRCFRDPAAIHAMCEDYRAAASIDLEHDRADREAGRRLRCPVLALWGGRATMGRLFDVPACWREVCDAEVSGHALDCGHFLAEEKPAELLEALEGFLEG
jgi:haloacetate dehalogenase